MILTLYEKKKRNIKEEKEKSIIDVYLLKCNSVHNT